MNNFEQASRINLRIPSVQGPLLPEDLWNVPMQTTRNKVASLDNIAGALHTKLKDTSPNFINPGSTSNTDVALSLAFDLVKYVIQVRLAEQEAKSTIKARAERKQYLLSLQVDKQRESDSAMSAEQIAQELATL